MGTWQLEPARGVSRGLSLRALLLLGSTVVLLIVGLLGMHALDGSAARHGATGSAHASSAIAASTGAQQVGVNMTAALSQQDAHHAAPHASAAVGAAAHKDLQCADACGAAPLGHEHTVIACVLALLSGLLLLAPPRSLARAWVPAVPLLSTPGAGSTQIGPPPPSLIQLSISRT